MTLFTPPPPPQVLLEFHTDDTAAEKDALVELSFHVPATSKVGA